MGLQKPRYFSSGIRVSMHEVMRYLISIFLVSTQICPFVCLNEDDTAKDQNTYKYRILNVNGFIKSKQDLSSGTF